MKSKFLVILLSIFPFLLCSQTLFEPGYIVTNDGERVELLIKNKNWKNTPSKIKTKLQSNSDIKSYDINTIIGFGIGNDMKYIKKTVQIDGSVEKTEVSRSYKPILISKTVFLEVLIEGTANLYKYHDDLGSTFFIMKNGKLETLVFKQNKSDSGNLITNYTYRSQLQKLVFCPNMSVLDIQILEYTEEDLVKHFKKFYECQNEPPTFTLIRKKQDRIHLYVKGGARVANVHYRTNSGFIEFKSVYGVKPRLGFEFEYILPFNSKKWSLTLEPSYQFFNYQGNVIYLTEPETRSVDVDLKYQSIEVPLGFRYYTYLNEDVKIFAGLSWMIDLPLKSYINFDSFQFNDEVIDSRANLNFNLGCSYKRFYLDTRIGYRRNIVRNSIGILTVYNNYTVSLAYQLY